MGEDQIRCFLERLRTYHGAIKIRLEMEFDDGQTVVQETVE